MDRSEGPQSPVETEGVSEGGTLDMDFIKSFLNKTDEDPADSKSGSLAEGEELENKAEKEETEEGTMEVKQELKKRRRKKKVIKRAINGKPPPAPKEDIQVSGDEQNNSKHQEKQTKPIPKPRKSLHRPTSAQRQRLYNRPASAPRQRSPTKSEENEVDSDLESIEQVERQNQTPVDTVPPPKPKRSAKGLRVRPQSASKYESIKRADHLSLSAHGNSSKNEKEFQELSRSHGRVRFDDTVTKESPKNTAELRGQKLHHTSPKPPATSAMSRVQYTYKDYHSEPLKQKYEELNELYSRSFHETKVKKRDNPEVVNYAKGMLRKYGVKVVNDSASLQRHLINPDLQATTSTSNPAARRSQNRPLRAYNKSHDTDDSGYSGRRSKSPTSSEERNEPVMIDVSHDFEGKHVKFAGGGDMESSVCDSASLDQDSEDILTVEREIALQSLSNKGRPSSGRQRGRKGKPSPRSAENKQSRSKTPDSACSSLSRGNSSSPPRSGGRFWSTDTSDSDSPSPVRGVPTDCDLRNSGNTSIQQWLKKKNREIRKKKRQERKKHREAMKDKDKEAKDKEERLEQSHVKVTAWMKLKKKETRLLRRKQRNNTNVLQITKSGNKFKFGGKVEVTEEVTVGNVENRENMVADGKEKEDTDVSCQGAGKQGQMGVKGRALSQKRPTSASKATKTSVVEVNMKGQESSASCTCGFAETQRLKEEELKQARLAARMRALEAQRARQAEKAKRELLKTSTARVAFSTETQGDQNNTPTPSENLPDISKQGQGFKGKKLTNKDSGKKDEKTEPQSAEEKLKQQRKSYDNWLKKKREEHKKKQKEEQKQKEEIEKGVDDETKEVVQKVARRRIDNILQGKKHIDTGIEKIDIAANASMEERIQAKKSAAKNKEPRDSNQVSTPERDEVTESNGIFLTEQPRDPETPKYVLPPDDQKDSPNDNKTSQKSKTKQRPSSARPASADSKPKWSRPTSAKSGLGRPSSRADKVTADHQNPFKLPHPPAPRRHSPSPPRPKVKVTPAYKNVKYQQRSWDNFSEFVWDDVNKDVEDEYQKHERPEPMGADNPDEVPKSSGNVSSKEKTKTGSVDKDEDGSQSKSTIDVESEPTASDVDLDEKSNGEKVEPSTTPAETDEEEDGRQSPTRIDDADAYTDDFEEEGNNSMSIPSIQIKSPSPEMEENFEAKDVAKDTGQNEATEKKETEEEDNKGLNEEDPGFFEEIHRQVDAEFRKQEAERLKYENDETLEKDEVDNNIPILPTVEVTSKSEEPAVSSKKKDRPKSGKSVRFSEEVETQEFVYTEEDDYCDDTVQGASYNGFGSASEQIQFEVALPVDDSEDVDKKDDAEEMQPSTSADDAVSFMMKGIMDSASKNVSNMKKKVD